MQTGQYLSNWVVTALLKGVWATEAETKKNPYIIRDLEHHEGRRVSFFSGQNQLAQNDLTFGAEDDRSRSPADVKKLERLFLQRRIGDPGHSLKPLPNIQQYAQRQLSWMQKLAMLMIGTPAQMGIPAFASTSGRVIHLWPHETCKGEIMTQLRGDFSQPHAWDEFVFPKYMETAPELKSNGVWQADELLLNNMVPSSELTQRWQ